MSISRRELLHALGLGIAAQIGNKIGPNRWNK
jgi:hypothetical protein